MKMFIQATTASGTFFRAGRMFTKAGVVVDRDAFTETELKAIEKEPNLKVREATREEIDAVQDAIDQTTDVDVLNLLITAIPQLTDADFTAKGLPDLSKLRLAVDVDPKLVTNALRDQAMEKLVEGGFQAPVKTST